jgi:hypothetical protein
MKRSFTLFMVSLMFNAIHLSARGQALISFDSFLPATGDYILIPNGYANLQWDNFGVLNGAASSRGEGYYTGTVSPDNVAFNRFGTPASIYSSSAFRLDSGYLTSAFVKGLQVRVQGFSGANVVYDNTYTLSTSGPLFVQFNYSGVDKVTFEAIPETQFVLDNLTVTPIISTNSCTYAISPAEGVYTSESATGLVSVVASDGCPWSVSNTNLWITILSGQSGAGSGTVSYQVQSNSTPVSRSGFISIAGQIFAVSQSPLQPLIPTIVDLGNVEVSTLGHRTLQGPPLPGRSSPGVAEDYFIDQSQTSGGGSVLPLVSVDWNTNHQFQLTVSAPPGSKFVIRVPDGGSAKFGGFLWWNSSGGGFSSAGSVKATFQGLEGKAPDFSASYSVLADSHGFFGFGNIDSTPFTSDIAFSSITLTGNTAPQYTIETGAVPFTPHGESSFEIVSTPAGSNSTVTIVSQLDPQLRVAGAPSIQSTVETNGDITLSFTGVLQSSPNIFGPFQNVTGNPLGAYSIPKANQTSQQFFRVKAN